MGVLDTQTLRERVHDFLKQEILENRIAPGTVLQEVPLATSLGMSRGPIREALNRLAMEGLVTMTPRRGAVVTSLTKRDFLDAYRIREALEALAVELAVPRMTGDDLRQLDAHIESMAQAAAARDFGAFFTGNAAFHEALVVASGNRKLVELYGMLVGQMAPYRRPSVSLRGSFEESITEHRQIVAAARAGDVARAIMLTQNHIGVPQRRLEALTEDEFREASGISLDAAPAPAFGEIAGPGQSR